MAADCKLGSGAASRFHLLSGDALISLPKARREDGAPCKDMSRIGLVAGPGCMQWGRVFASKKRPGLQNKHRGSMSVQFADGRSIAFVVEGVLRRRRKLQRQVLVRVAGSEAVGSWRAVRGANWAMRDVCCFTQCDGDRHQASHTAPPCDRTAWCAPSMDDCSWREAKGVGERALERCICSASQMTAFDDGDDRGTRKADGRHPSTVPSHPVPVWPAVSTTSGATRAPQSAYGGTVRLQRIRSDSRVLRGWCQTCVW